MNGLDPASLMELAAAMAAVGVLAGLLAGLLGVGGGIVTVPVLFFVLDFLGIDAAISMHMAVGTSLGAIIPTAIMSARSHRAKGAVDETLFKLWSVPIFLGAAAGAALAGQVRGPVLNAVFATGALTVALYMLFTRDAVAEDATHAPGPTTQRGLAGLIGAVSAMMGIGGGTFSVPVLSAFGYPVRRAVGTSAALGLMIAIPGALGFMLSGWTQPGLPPLSMGYVNLIGVALLAPSAMICAPWGARLAHSIPPRALRLAFAIFLLATAAKMAMSLMG